MLICTVTLQVWNITRKHIQNFSDTPYFEFKGSDQFDSVRPTLGFNGNPADKNRRGATCWTWMIFTFKDKNLNYLYFLLLLVQLTFSHCQNSKKVMYKSSRIFLPEKGTFAYQHPKRLNRIFWDHVLRIPYQIRKSQIFCFWLLSLVSQILLIDPNNIVLWWDELGSPGLHGISPTLNITATNPENSNATLSVRYRKNIISRLWPNVLDGRLKSLFPGAKSWKMARDLTMAKR